MAGKGVGLAGKGVGLAGKGVGLAVVPCAATALLDNNNKPATIPDSIQPKPFISFSPFSNL